MASTSSGTDIQAKPTTSTFIDNIFQDTSLLALSVWNIPSAVVDNAFYRYGENMIETVQEKLCTAGAANYLADDH